MAIWRTYIGVSVLMIISAGLIESPGANDQSSERIAAYLKLGALDFTKSAAVLETAISKLETGSPASVTQAKRALVLCRLQYKRIAFLLDYFFLSESVVFNAPPKYEVDEPDMEYQHPRGLQVIEALLYSRNTRVNKKAMLEQVQLVARSAAELPTLLYNFKATAPQVLESIKLELIRVMTLYITGYDAPQLKSGIEEALASLMAMQKILTPYLSNYYEKDSIDFYLQSCIQYLEASKGFDKFDRLHFLTLYALPLQLQLSRMTWSTGIGLNTVPVLNDDLQNLFSADAFNKDAFSKSDPNDSLLISLGRKLFSDKVLSGNYTRSCASCHIPTKYFQDGMVRNNTLDHRNHLPRNTPGLLYSIYQYSQFWDGRAKNANEQALIVLHNKKEMNGQDDTIINRLQLSTMYSASFKKIWAGQSAPVNMQNLTVAINAYIKALSPFQSPFDHYMQGDSTALTINQQRGFNLFMGKAACGTCHFAPLFNGLTPPFYNKTEYENIGTTLTDNLAKPIADKDNGRYGFFPIEFYTKAFKTPTVRNAAMTAPYMHNGGFKKLGTVMDFYDNGGGAGLGLNEPYQTLSAEHLHLTAAEKGSIIAFLNSLTDDKNKVTR